ncbi:hypothetical protein [Clostridium psychrophilum]|uniref:hypothetical protein n=1 Tax=Clostridium psychrophilum TaxID=132926 RepID=UPI001C0CF6AB|nr:hypothetical protein [Clostridium psychrophilum]MBU3182176.1 hypothetical protein [Clostridium psychrophilum]
MIALKASTTSTATALKNIVSSKKTTTPALSGLSEAQMNQLVSTNIITTAQEQT